MRLTSTRIHTMSFGNAMTDDLAHQYASYVRGQYEKCSGGTGWLKGSLERLRSNFEYYMSSELWRKNGGVTQDPNRYAAQYEYFRYTDLASLHNARGVMQHVIMANPAVRELYYNEQIKGYEGINDNPLWEEYLSYKEHKVLDGNVRDYDGELIAKNYITSRDNFTRLTLQQRHDAIQTWHTTDKYIEMGLDPTAKGMILEKKKDSDDEA